jgi:hypothetical protein
MVPSTCEGLDAAVTLNGDVRTGYAHSFTTIWIFSVTAPVVALIRRVSLPTPVGLKSRVTKSVTNASVANPEMLLKML